jgi:hypothetical protein
MRVFIHRRAEIAIRSLSAAEQKRVARALTALGAMKPQELIGHQNLRQLATPSGAPLFTYRMGESLRLVLSLDSDQCTIEDVVDQDRLARLADQ